jgi:hypothetical protein
MLALHVSSLAGVLGLLAIGCASSRGEPIGGAGQTGLTGSAFGQPFAGRSTLLVHPRAWKSAAAGSTALLVSDTLDLCQQITSRVTTAPGRLVIVSLEQAGADGAVAELQPGQFLAQGQGTPLSRYGEVFLNAVDAQCGFDKLFSDQSSIQVDSVGPAGSSLSVSLDVHFTSGDSLQGSLSATASCDEAAVDEYLNGGPKCR